VEPETVHEASIGTHEISTKSFGRSPDGKGSFARPRSKLGDNNVTDLINAFPGNSFVNTVQHATTEEAEFSVDPTDALIDRLDSDNVICLL
jgi:hypothetical protein